MLAVVIESINTKVIDSQRLVGRFFFRFHVSDDISIGELQEIMKFKINVKIQMSIIHVNISVTIRRTRYKGILANVLSKGLY